MVPKSTYQKYEHEENSSNDHHPPRHWSSLPIFCPLSSSLRIVLLELLSAKLVVDQPSQGNAVTEHLEGRDWITENDHGCNNQENILENTAESVDERGSFANL